MHVLNTLLFLLPALTTAWEMPWKVEFFDDLKCDPYHSTREIVNPSATSGNMACKSMDLPWGYSAHKSTIFTPINANCSMDMYVAFNCKGKIVETLDVKVADVCMESSCDWGSFRVRGCDGPGPDWP